MKMAIIGTGNVGSVLGTHWAKNGHQVIFGTRDPDSPKVKGVLNAAGPNAQAASASEAVAGAEVVVLATPWNVTQQIIQSVGNLSEKIVIDCTNPLSGGGLSVGHTTSAGEQVAEWATGARVVKAFNTTGAKNMGDPVYGSQPATMFICGDEAEAKSAVAGLAGELGFEVVDAGPLAVARYLEPLAALWVHLAYRLGLGPDIAFKLLRR
jgi:NADPH-dependent F420 reductase